MLRSEGDELRRVVVSTPGEAYFTVTDLAAHNINERPDRAKTLEQRVQERTDMLVERETHFRTIVETAADGIISTDAKGNIESFNPASERLFGYPASEVIGRAINTLMPTLPAALVVARAASRTSRSRLFARSRPFFPLW